MPKSFEVLASQPQTHKKITEFCKLLSERKHYKLCEMLSKTNS